MMILVIKIDERCTIRKFEFHAAIVAISRHLDRKRRNAYRFLATLRFDREHKCGAILFGLPCIDGWTCISARTYVRAGIRIRVRHIRI